MEFHSTVKKNDELTCATTRMNLKNMLHERTQMQMMTYCMTTFTENVQPRQVYKNRKQISGYQGRDQLQTDKNFFVVM